MLGAGLQGACIALELARRGAKVDLYERNEACVAEASAHNEGKVHLGFVYAFDQSFATPGLWPLEPLASSDCCGSGLAMMWKARYLCTLRLCRAPHRLDGAGRIRVPCP